MAIEYGQFVEPAIKLIELAYRKWRGRRRALTPIEILNYQKRWKPEFEKALRQRRKKKLNSDVIVRDVTRLSKYPDIDEKSRGTSPWFRAGLVGTYHSGVEILLGWYTLTIGITGQLRYTDYSHGEQGDINVALIGYVPYEQIEHVDWDGDEYYGFPVLFCYFDTARKEPYARLAFCRSGVNPHPEGDIEFYSEVCDFDVTHEYSQSIGIRHAS